MKNVIDQILAWPHNSLKAFIKRPTPSRNSTRNIAIARINTQFLPTIWRRHFRNHRARPYCVDVVEQYGHLSIGSAWFPPKVFVRSLTPPLSPNTGCFIQPKKSIINKKKKHPGKFHRRHSCPRKILPPYCSGRGEKRRGVSAQHTRFMFFRRAHPFRLGGLDWLTHLSLSQPRRVSMCMEYESDETPAQRFTTYSFPSATCRIRSNTFQQYSNKHTPREFLSTHQARRRAHNAARILG